MLGPMTHRPQIDYPCSWSYRVIGESEVALRAAVREAVGAHPHEFVAGRSSAQGRYVSCTLTLTVRDEPHRLEIFRALAQHEAIRYVL